VTHAYIPEFRERFGVELGTVWAQTESGAQGAGALRTDLGARGEGYIGPPLGEEEIRIVAPDGTPLPPGEVGEIQIRDRYVMLGYLNDPEGTKTALVDGWISCGDFGSLDEQGGLRYHGRLKNMVKRSGENISPEEIETVIIEHPSVVEVVAFGVPDRLRTEELAVVVVTRSDVDPAALEAFVASRAARWKAPRYVDVRREPLDRLPSGKLDRVGTRKSLDLDTCWDRERRIAEDRPPEAKSAQGAPAGTEDLAS
jgi:acyl-CoA synthetase (AMP-forming)/AMP-acid ligase II